jgi:predicted MFS family arabinose efflux permease
MRLGGNALLGTLLNLGVIAGPAAAGFLTAGAGAASVLGLDALSWLIYAGCVILAQGHSARTFTVAASDSSGPSALRMILADRALLSLLILTLAFFFFYGPVEVALPIFVKQDLHQSAAVLGAFWTCFGIGAVTGGVVFGIIRRAPLFPSALVIIVGWGATLGVIPFVNVPLGITAFTLGGLIWAPYPTLVTTFLQQQASGRCLTTLSAGWTSATMLATPLGTAIGGPLVAATGAGETLLISALATLAIIPVAAIARRF